MKEIRHFLISRPFACEQLLLNDNTHLITLNAYLWAKVASNFITRTEIIRHWGIIRRMKAE